MEDPLEPPLGEQDPSKNKLAAQVPEDSMLLQLVMTCLLRDQNKQQDEHASTPLLSASSQVETSSEPYPC